MKIEQLTWEQRITLTLADYGLTVQSFHDGYVLCLTRDGSERKVEIIYDSEANNADKR